MDKIYDPKSVEDGIYKRWEESGYFNPDNIEGEPYSIMMPPPNVTGVLHLGHSLENSLMDVMARFQRMQGKKVLLLPGTDHARSETGRLGLQQEGEGGWLSTRQVPGNPNARHNPPPNRWAGGALTLPFSNRLPPLRGL